MTMKKKYGTEPPDGGYGWVIVVANGLSTFISVSLLPCLGLIFKDTFPEAGLSAIQSALIINLNGAFGKVCGPITGVLLKYIGCRQTVLLSAAFFTLGMIFTSYSNSFITYVLAYGIITSIGMQMSELGVRFAVNVYFKKQRSVAMGYSVTIAGLGPIILPQLFSLLLKYYSQEQVILIMAGLCANVFAAGMLIQPVKWHMKTVELPEPEQGELLEKKEEEKKAVEQFELEPPPQKPLIKRFLEGMSRVFDLDLLKDPIFVNILIGLSLANFAELNYTILLPFILADFNLSTDQIANFLTTLGVADLIFRFIGPHIGNYFTKPSRVMYAYALLFLVVIRFSLLLTDNYYLLLLIAFGLGIGKGLRKVYMYLVIPDYVDVDKLASSGGMETLTNGICILLGGPFLGALRDITGSYKICIIVMNLVTIFTILIWGTEALGVRYYRKRRAPLNDNV